MLLPQKLLSDQTALVCETGDSWFHGQEMKLPQGCDFHFQMQYGVCGVDVSFDTSLRALG